MLAIFRESPRCHLALSAAPWLVNDTMSRHAPPPCDGDRILVLRQPWLDLILRGEKTMEIRSRRVRPGLYYIGMRGVLYGRVHLKEGSKIETEKSWQKLRRRHQVDRQELPYERTWGFELENVQHLRAPVPYNHPRGAIGFVRFRPVVSV